MAGRESGVCPLHIDLTNERSDRTAPLDCPVKRNEMIAQSVYNEHTVLVFASLSQRRKVKRRDQNNAGWDN